MKKLKLIDIAPYSGKRVRPFQGLKRYMSTGDLKDEELSFTEIDYPNKPSRADIEVQEGDVLFAKMTNTNKALLIEKEFDRIIVSTGFSVHKPKENELDGEYLLHYLKHDYFHRQKNKLCTGAIQSAISNKGIEKILVPVPDYSDQRQIANILSKVENLIAQRKESIALLDEFLKSKFTDLFDNPVTNRKNYPIVFFKELIKFLTSGGRGWKKYYAETGNRFIRSLDVQMNYISDTDIVFVSPPNNQEAKRTKVLPYDILLTITGSKIGRVSVVPENFGIGYVSQHVSIIRTEGINPLYLSYYLSDENCGQYLIKKSYYGQTKPGLNFKQIENFEILVPPVELQTQFVRILETTEALKAQYQQSLQELENLYGSLGQQAFGGELKLEEQEEGILIAAEPELQYQPQPQLSIPPTKKGFAKLVLAGKIINECKDSLEFTNIKFQKLQHLAEHLMEVDLNLNYYNQAAGPYDNKFMHTLHNKMKQQKWFASRGYKYSSMEKVNEIDGHFSRYFGNDNEHFPKLIKLLGKASEDQCEIISTIYAVWNDRIIKKEPVTNETIIQDFFHWSDRKQKYNSKQLTKAIAWMKENGLEPKGFGELIKHSKKK